MVLILIGNTGLFRNEFKKGGNDADESQRLVYLLKKLRSELSESILLTADISPGPWVGPQYLPEIQEHVDYVNLMAFDFTGQWNSSKVSHHAEFGTFLRAVNQTVSRGFKPEKMLVGLPTYGKNLH